MEKRMSHSVIIKDAMKRYGDFTAVNKVNLEIQAGEFFTLLGPSGCGKTTLLRMIAGFNEVDGGEIFFDDKCINTISAHKRDIGMVFQNYAIFPHLNVSENVEYGLKARKVASGEIKDKTETAMDMVHISQLKNRKPNELSGGQQQRVALARAFVIEPSVLLMDEPLSNLDAKLRVQMRGTIKKLQQDLGITTIYVTHDQEEALAISDRIAVMKDGNIMQVGTPVEVYNHPANTFVANFIGVSNFMECVISKSTGSNYEIKLGDICISGFSLRQEYEGDGILSARPEQLYFSESGLKGKIIFSTFLGDFVQYEILLNNGQTVILNEYTKDTRVIRPNGESVFISFDVNTVNLYRKDNNEVLS